MRLNENKVNIWIEHYTKNANIKKVIKYISDNKKCYDDFNDLTTDKMICNKKNIQEIIYFSFLDSINASKYRKLDDIFKSTINVIKIIEGISTEGQIDFIGFIKKFDNNLNNINEFFDHLVSKNPKNNFPGLKEKKASLFIRELYLINKFKNFDWNNFKYKIALDNVIENLFNIMLGFTIENNNRIIAQNDFYNFNSFIEKAELDKEIIESLWFWGYFNSKNNGENFRIIEFNKEKYYTNPFFYPENEKLKKTLSSFSDLFKKYFPTNR